MASSSNGNLNARHMFLFMYDQLMKTNKPHAAKLFAKQVGLGDDPNVSELPDGYLPDFTSTLWNTCQSILPTPFKGPFTQDKMASNIHIGQAGNGGQGPNAGDAGGLDLGEDGQNKLMPPQRGCPSTGMGEYTARMKFSDFGSFSPVPTQGPHFWSSKSQGDHTSYLQHNEQWIRDSEIHVPIGENSLSYLLSNEDNSGLMRTSTSMQRCTTPCKISEPNGLTFEETRSFRPTNDKLLCCHFSGCGKLLATAGHEKKVFIWSLQNSELLHSLEGHSDIITDVRFQRIYSVVATSSVDRTIRIWDCRKPRKPLVQLLGHDQPVNSVDFHPIKMGVLASCDSSGEIRIWNVDEGSRRFTLMGGTRQVRFQPQIGKYLASASGNKIYLFDLEEGGRRLCLEGHVEEVRSLCWEIDGKCLASVSEDSARIWSIGPTIKSIWVLPSSGSKFESCIFHPGYSPMLAIGSFQTISLWNPAERNNPNYTASVTAHNGVVAALSSCSLTVSSKKKVVV